MKASRVTIIVWIFWGISAVFSTISIILSPRQWTGLCGLATIILCIILKAWIDRVDARRDLVRRAEKVVLYDCPSCEDRGVEDERGGEVFPCRECPVGGAVFQGRHRRQR